TVNSNATLDGSGFLFISSVPGTGIVLAGAGAINAASISSDTSITFKDQTNLSFGGFLYAPQVIVGEADDGPGQVSATLTGVVTVSDSASASGSLTFAKSSSASSGVLQLNSSVLSVLADSIQISAGTTLSSSAPLGLSVTARTVSLLNAGGTSLI